MVRDMPFTGVGLNTFPLVQAQFYPGLLLGPEPHAHSLFLHTAVDLGWPGVLALLWLLVAFYVTTARAQRLTADRDLQVLLVGLAAGVTAFAVHGLVDTVTLGAKPVAALFAMFGLAAAVYHYGRCEQEAGAESGLAAGRPPRRAALQALVALLVLLPLLALPLLALPAAPALNAGMLRAHKVLLAARTTGSASAADLEAALAPLRRAAERAPENVYVWERLGSLYAWQGDYAAAVAAIERRVALDGGQPEPMARYAPFEVARRRVQRATGQDPWEDLLWVYRHWNDRYPQRAEGYVLHALVWAQHKGDPARARAVLQSGLDAGAEPAGLLAYYAALLEGAQ
jgi:tetratricopeptide (TPR) repeat protein